MLAVIGWPINYILFILHMCFNVNHHFPTETFRAVAPVRSLRERGTCQCQELLSRRRKTWTANTCCGELSAWLTPLLTPHKGEHHACRVYMNGNTSIYGWQNIFHNMDISPFIYMEIVYIWTYIYICIKYNYTHIYILYYINNWIYTYINHIYTYIYIYIYMSQYLYI